jgi:hypothetical protein
MTPTPSHIIEQVKKALEFYSNPGDYKAPYTGGMGKLYYDCGVKATEALALLTQLPQQVDEREDCPWRCKPDNANCLCAKKSPSPPPMTLEEREKLMEDMSREMCEADGIIADCEVSQFPTV